MGRLAPDNRPIAADILRGRSSSPQLCTTEEASFISKVASHQCSLWPARFSLSENRPPSEFCARNSNRPMETFHLAGPLQKKMGGGHKFLATRECSLGDSSPGSALRSVLHKSSCILANAWPKVLSGIRLLTFIV